MDDFTFEDKKPEQGITFKTETYKEPPLDQHAVPRAEKFAWTLGQNSNDVLAQIQTGDEPALRSNTARQEDLALERAKLDILKSIAQSGHQLDETDWNIVQGLTAQQMKTDPASILEKKFSQKYMETVLQPNLDNQNKFLGKNFNPVSTPEAAVGAHLVEQNQWYQHQAEDVEAEGRKNGTLYKVVDWLSQALPFVPWYLQRAALSQRPGVEFLPGSTMEQNILWLRGQPFDQQKIIYKQAIDYLKSRSQEAAETFARAMHSFGSSDYYLANSMGMADDLTLGLPIVKGAMKLSGIGTKSAVKLDPLAIVKAAEGSQQFGDYHLGQNLEQVFAGPIQASKWTPPAERAAARVSDPSRQLDLFGVQPAQGEFGTIVRGSQLPPEGPITPTGLYRAPSGQMRKGADRFETFGKNELDGNGKLVSHTYELGKTKPYPEVSPTGIYRGEGGRFGLDTSAMKQTELGLGPVVREQLPLPFQRGGGGVPKPDWNTPDLVEIKRAVIGAVKALGEGGPVSIPSVLAHMGDVQTSGLLSAMELIKSKGNFRGLKDLAKYVPTFSNPPGFMKDSGVISRERALALAPQLERNAAGLVQKYIGIQRVARLTPEAETEGYRLAEAAMVKDLSGRVGVLDIKYTPKEMIQFVRGKESATNSNYLIGVVGKPDLTLFKDLDEANLWKNEIYKYGSAAEPVQHGKGYKLEIYQTLDETGPSTREAMIGPNNRSNTSMVNMLVGRLRSAADIVSQFQRGGRSIATHSPQEMQAIIMGEITRDIQSLPTTSRRMVERVLELNRDTYHPVTGLKGTWYDTSGQFETAFKGMHGRLPTEPEIIAYDTYKRLSDFDYIMRNTTVYRDKARLGVEQFSFKVGGGQSPWFEGKQLDAFPWKLGRAGENDNEAGIWIYNSTTGEGRFRYKHDMTAQERKELDAKISDEGYRVVQVFDAKTHPLASIAKTADGSALKDQVHYIVTNTWDKQPLSIHQVEYRPGVHVIYAHDWYVAQSDIRAGRTGKETFFGDNVALNVRTRAEGQKWADRMNIGRVMLKEGRDAELAPFLAKNLPYSEDEFRNLFRRSDSPFSLEHPITVKEKNKNTFESNPGLREKYKHVVDATKSPYDMSNWMDKSFLADRDRTLPTIHEGPGGVMTLREAEQLDPYIALQKAMGQELRNVWMNDHKIAAIESWLQEFSGTGVFQPSDHQLVSHPTFFLYNMQWNENADKALLAAAKAQQRAIVNFLGARSELGGQIEHIKAKLIDGIYNKTGGAGLDTLGKLGKITDNMGLPNIKDPITFLRAIAFNEKMGLFNPVHLILQGLGAVHAAALSPLSWVQGLSGGQLARYLVHNPAQIDTLANVAVKMGWKREDFIEMVRAMDNSGVMRVAGETSMRDDVFDPKLFKTRLATWLDKGAFFFNEGEKFNRLTSFATAFHEWKRLNPGRKVTDQAMGDIMDRYRTMALDMTRDANAEWQSNKATSLSTQFFAYNARFMEQMVGGRLTGAEKFRALTVYSALYGIPATTGGLTMGLSPLGWAGVPSTYEDIKQYAYQNGININEGFLKTATEGVMQLGVHWLTGRDYNTTERFSPGASTAISKWFKEDTHIAEIAFGAVGGIMGDTIKSLYPFAYYAASVFNGSSPEYKLTGRDLVRPTQNINSMDIAVKAYGALNYGKWYTKSSTSVGDADGLDAFMAAFGLTRQDLADTYQRMGAIKNVETLQKGWSKSAMENWRLGLQAGQAGDFKLLNDYWTRANADVVRGNFTNEQSAKLYTQAMKQGADLKDKINWDLVRKGGAEGYGKRLDNVGR